MVAPNLKAETISLMDMRASMEAEMDAIIESLCGPSGPGLSDNLVDSEGFPRTDIDVSAVRSQRRRLAELRNDHKDITGQIEKNLLVLHSLKLNKVTPSPPESSDQTSYGNLPQGSLVMEDSILQVPFAIIDEIADDSPAAEDGLQLGDEIVKFGNVQMGDELQSRLVEEAQSNHGNPIHMEIVRQGVMMHATVTPRTWRGRGLLGYNSLSSAPKNDIRLVAWLHHQSRRWRRYSTSTSFVKGTTGSTKFFGKKGISSGFWYLPAYNMLKFEEHGDKVTLNRWKKGRGRKRHRGEGEKPWT